MTAGRLRRRAGHAEPAGDEGPFVSFTDLFIGILFLFLILVAVLMLMHQQAVAKDKSQAQQIAEQLQEIQSKFDTRSELDADHPPFRLALVYNVYQTKPGDPNDWRFSRTVQVYRTANDICLNSVILKSNLSFAWKPPIKSDAVPTAADQNYIRGGDSCMLTASGQRWDTDSETGGVRRTSRNLYSGSSVLHKYSGNETVGIQYRILGIYDDYYQPGAPKAGDKAIPAAAHRPT